MTGPDNSGCGSPSASANRRASSPENLHRTIFRWLFSHPTGRVTAGFSPTVDARRLDSIRRKVARGQHMITLHDARFLLVLLDEALLAVYEGQS